MSDLDLPGPVRSKVEALRARPKYAHLVDVLLKKRQSAPPEQRQRYEQLILDLDKPSGIYWILGPVAAVIVLGVAYHLYSELEYEKHVDSGIPTLARVARVDEGFCVFGENGNRCVELTVELHEPSGQKRLASFTRDIDLQWMSRVQPGSWLTVAVDRNDPSKVYFDERSMAVPAPTPP